jgi:hypothetical protein
MVILNKKDGKRWFESLNSTKKKVNYLTIK